MRNNPSIEFEQLREEVQLSQIGYLLPDLELGATFARMAMESSNEEKRARTTRKARRVYDAVLRFSSQFALTEMEQHDMDEQLGFLKSDLLTLGETF